MPEEKTPVVKLNFKRKMDNVVGENADQFFKSQLVRMLKSSATVKSFSESEALGDLRGDIARDKEPTELTKGDLDLLEKNVEKALQNDGTRIPNNLVEEIGDLLKEGREKLPDRGEE